MIDTISALKRKSNEIRRGIIDLVYKGQVGHIGGALSSCDILTAIYYRYLNIAPDTCEDPDRDRFVLSKGHCVEGYLNILADKGFIEKDELNTFCCFGSRLIAHPNKEIPGIEMNTGALGHGLSAACGMALAGKMQHKSYRVFALMGDGEQGEGSIWEAAMFAANNKLDNLYAVLDRNQLQISGPTEKIMQLEPLKQKWESFGFHVAEIDGNNMAEIVDTFDKLLVLKGKPKLILANTIKGKGVSFMENQTAWHHGSLNDQQYQIAVRDLEEAARSIENE